MLWMKSEHLSFGCCRCLLWNVQGKERNNLRKGRGDTCMNWGADGMTMISKVVLTVPAQG